MNQFNFSLIHILHNMRIDKSAILADDFTESVNLDIAKPDLNAKIKALADLQNQALIEIDGNDYVGLTDRGGKFWENNFLIDWSLYFEYGSQFINDKEHIFLYATDKNTLKTAMKHSGNLLHDTDIKPHNWQAIYWKNPFIGYGIEKALDSELLPYFDDVLPSYHKFNLTHSLGETHE